MTPGLFPRTRDGRSGTNKHGTTSEQIKEIILDDTSGPE